MTDILGCCPRCGRPTGRCVHTTEGQVTVDARSLPRLSEDDVSDQYAARAGTIGQPVDLIGAHNPTRPQTADLSPQLPASPAAAGGADSIRQALYAPACAVCVVLELEASKERIASISEAMTRAAIKAAEASRADTGSAQS